MNIQIEVDGNRRTIITNGFKIYGSDTELRQIADAIHLALGKGLVQGWIGVGAVDDPTTVFPNNGRQDIPTTSWKD